jgi:hypothetical protein
LSIAKPDGNTFVIASEDHPAMFGLPEFGYVNMPEIKQIENQQLEVSLTQSWDWQQANDIVSQCSYELLITSHKYSINQILDNNTHEQVVFFHQHTWLLIPITLLLFVIAQQVRKNSVFQAINLDEEGIYIHFVNAKYNYAEIAEIKLGSKYKRLGKCS